MILVTGALMGVLATWLEANDLGSHRFHEQLLRFKSSQRLSLDEAAGWMERVIQLHPRPAGGLDIAQHVQWQHLGALSHMLAGVQNLEDLLHTYLSYEELFYDEKLASIQRNADAIEISWRARQMHPLLAQLTIGAFGITVRRMYPAAQPLLEVGFQFQDEWHRDHYQAFFGCPVQFATRRTYLRFDLAHVRDPIAPGHQSLAGALRARALVSGLGPASGMMLTRRDEVFLDRVILELVQLLPRQEANIGNLARCLVVSVRTLQRQLAAYSHWFPDGFRGLLGVVRYALAREYLRDDSLDLASVALLLGYGEQSAFNLAFKRWAEMTPGQWRRQFSISAIQLPI